MAMVSLARCDSYVPERLLPVMEKGLSDAGFDPAQFGGARVAIKPNLLTVARDDQAVITHPEFFRAAVRLVRHYGGIPVLVESPAVYSLRRVIKKTGYGAVVEDESVAVADPAPVKTLHYEGAARYKHIDVSEAYFDADVILCLPKFKTHGITHITGAVKLLFGAMPGMEKSKMHLRLPRHADFADFLLDFYGAMTHGFPTPKPMVHLMDAVLAMEGEGPGHSGRPRQMNAVITGMDAIAVDWVATRLAGLDVGNVPTLVKGFQRGYGVRAPGEIKVVGASLEDMQIRDFVPATGDSMFANSDRWPLNTPTFKNLFVERPVPGADLCTLCYECKKICPAGAIRGAEDGGRVPQYDYGACIRCYCCVEICPEGAIAKRAGRLQWMLGIFGK